MSRYDYTCPTHGLVEVVKPMTQAGRQERCPAGAGVMTRVFTPAGFIMRPSGWHLRPGDSGYSNFQRELELGEVRTPTEIRRYHVPEESHLAPPKQITYTEEQRYELAQMSMVMDRAIREEADI